MNMRLAISFLGILLFTIGIVTLSDSIYDRYSGFESHAGVNNFMVEGTTPIAIPASVGFMMAGSAFVLTGLSDRLWRTGK